MKPTNNPFHPWFSPKLEVKKTLKSGMGVFAVKAIKKDEVLTIFGGYIMTLEEESQLSEQMQDYPLQIADNFVIGIKTKKEVGPAEYFNHSCEPNAGFDGQIFLVAMRSIKKGEEITFDYAMTIGGKKKYTMKCLCEKALCRKIITNKDWKIVSLQQKYSGYFQWYINKQIKKK